MLWCQVEINILWEIILRCLWYLLYTPLLSYHFLCKYQYVIYVLTTSSFMEWTGKNLTIGGHFLLGHYRLICQLEYIYIYILWRPWKMHVHDMRVLFLCKTLSKNRYRLQLFWTEHFHRRNVPLFDWFCPSLFLSHSSLYQGSLSL